MSFQQQRERLVEHELRSLGIQDEAVLRAMLEIPRELFVSEEMREFAYRNSPLPIGCGQTISQPFIVAEMIESLKLSSTDRVLEIGTGSGYEAAVLSRIVEDVFTVERYRELAETAATRCRQLGYFNVHILVGDGTRGWPERAPFDAIIVSAGAPEIPPPLLHQLRLGGRLIIPVGETVDAQKLILAVRRGADKYEYEELGGARFVPLIGEAGWPRNDDS